MNNVLAYARIRWENVYIFLLEQDFVYAFFNLMVLIVFLGVLESSVPWDDTHPVFSCLSLHPHVSCLLPV